MGIIMWKKPRKARSSKDHIEMHQSDCEVPGTYVPNMSNDDMKRWKGKVVGTRVGHPQIEVRKYPFVMILSNGGYKYKYYTREKTENIVFHLSTSGAIQFTADELDEFGKVIEEMKEKLREISEDS